MSDFDVCIYCEADGCLDGTVQHAADCPATTGVHPVDQDMIDRETVCCDCSELFALGDHYVNAKPSGEDHLLVRQMGLANMIESVTVTVCLGCAAGRELTP